MRLWWGGMMRRLRKERRWIPDSDDRAQHQDVVRERLARKTPVTVSEAAERLGVTPQTIRRRVKDGKLDAEYGADGRISGVYLGDDQ